MDRWATVERFRARLREVIARSGLSQSAFAAGCGMDRSTLSQILSDRTDRLPRLETLVALAQAENVSLDWLLGLTDEGPLSAGILDQELEIAGGPLPSDERLAEWRREALGYKIRHVPVTVPDFVKTPAVLEYEYGAARSGTPEQRALAAAAVLEYERRPETDTEVCSSLQAVETLARGQGIWTGLDPETRRAQLWRLAELTDELYPTFRWFLYDARARYSAPLTVFGPLRAAIYIGQRYVVLNGRDQVDALARHFDDLIRAAAVQPHEVAKRFAAMAEEMERR